MGEVYVASNYPEIFQENPFVRGVSLEDIGKHEGARIVDVTKELIATKDKYLELCNAFGVMPHYLDAPKIYLNTREKVRAKEFGNLYDGTKIGIIVGSRNHAKNWGHTDHLIKYLAKKKHNIFIFDISQSNNLLGKNIIHVTEKNLRNFIIRLSAMDIVISPDSGGAHIAGALEIPVLVICPKHFVDLYQKYTSCYLIEGTPFNINNYQLPIDDYDSFGEAIKKQIYNKTIGAITKQAKQSILDVSVSRVLAGIEQILSEHKRPKKDNESIAIVRMRGIGDIILSLPAVKNYKDLYPETKITYITDSSLKPLLDNCPYINNVIGVKYKHETFGYPILPSGVDYSKYDQVYNLINKVDFEPDSYSIKRIDMFANLLDIDELNLDCKWQIAIPDQWKREAWDLVKSIDDSVERFISFQVDSQGLSRMWALNRQKSLIDKLTKRGLKIVLMSDKRYEILNDKVINLTGKMTLNQYFGMIAISSLVIGADSSAMHIAGMLGVQGFGLFGSIDPDLRISHYNSITPIISKLHCVPCNDWQTRSCGHEKCCPRCINEIPIRLIEAKIRKRMEKR